MVRFLAALSCCFCLALSLAAACPAWCAKAKAQEPDPAAVAAFAADPARTLADLGDRSPGTPGAARSAALVRGFFSSLGAGQVLTQTYLAPAKAYGPCSLKVEGLAEPLSIRQLDLNALTPAAASALSGPLVYGARGEMADLDGKAVAGAIVLLDLDSGRNWQNAAQLGAVAVVYLDHGEPGDAGFFRDKMELTPVVFPRFRLEADLARRIFGPVERAPAGRIAPRARIDSAAKWERVPAENVYLLVKGTDESLAGQAVIVEAFYDASPFVAGLGPGADQASSLAGLVEAAKSLAASPPRRTTLLAATSGQGQALAGFRECLGALTAKSSHERAWRKILDERARKAEAVLAALDRAQAPGKSSEQSSAETSGQAWADTSTQGPSKDAPRVSAESPDQGASRAEGENSDQAETQAQFKAHVRTSSKAQASGDANEALADPALAGPLETAFKDEADRTGALLAALRLEGREENQGVVAALTQSRKLLRQMIWRGDGLRNLSGPEAALVRGLLPGIREAYRNSLDQTRLELAAAKSARDLRNLMEPYTVTAAVSLHLSSHGDAVAAVSDGWLYELRPEINRVRPYAKLSRLLEKSAAHLVAADGSARFVDGLRADPETPWRGLFVDRPHLGGEVSALAGLPGFTLATANDSRGLWGTPQDTPDRVDRQNLDRQLRLVCGLVRSLADADMAKPEKTRSGFATLTVQAGFVRQGEPFADRPAGGVTAVVYQGKTRFPVMTGPDGSLRLPGLADARHVFEKAVVEAYRFSPEDGRAVWAVDRRATVKDSYRVRMRRLEARSNLVMFACRQSTLLGMFDSRSFRYFTRAQVFDARTDAEPTHYWLSRLDTLDSTLLSVFLEPGTRFKLTLSDTALARKALFTNAAPSRPEGVGYLVDECPLLPRGELLAARDMWSLVSPRLANLEAHGVTNQRLGDMQRSGTSRLMRAEKALADHDYSQGMSQARASLSLAGRVYNDVEKTQRDVLVGVLFYIALFAPFSYCLERLLFACADIHRRLAAMGSIMAVVIGLVWAAHPAFRITYNPAVVIVAFFLMVLAALVSGVILARFEREMAGLQRRSSHLKAEEIGHLKAFAAAFAIGVANLRRRKVRTALTCVTLVLLTFTILSFTSVKSVRLENSVRFSDAAAYQGILLRNLGWKSLPVEAENVLSDLGGQGAVAARAALESADRTVPLVASLSSGRNRARALGVMGLGPNENAVSGAGRALTAGRWFLPGENRAVLLPEDLAARLAVRPGEPGHDQVTLWGQSYTVVGLFSGPALDRWTDLDGEPLTPVVFPTESAVEASDAEKDSVESGEDLAAYQGRYEHLAGDSVIILPADTVLGLGGQLKSLALSGSAGGGASDLADRFGLSVYEGRPQGAFVVHAGEGFSYSGAANLAVPLAIAASIVLSTMIGAVYERKREIAVYTAVGLAPSHVAFLFVAEALAFAVISSVLGYLLAQGAAAVFSGTPVWQGMTANYSSLSGVASLLLVIAVVLASAIYPARVAARVAIPDASQVWTPPEPRGSTMKATLPFLMRLGEQDFAAGFLMQYLKSHEDVSHGLFATGDIGADFVCPWMTPGGGEHPGQIHEAFLPLSDCVRVSATVWLAPFDFGVNQRVSVSFLPALWHPGFMEIEVRLELEAGEMRMWKRLSAGFLNALRKQLLVYRTLDDEARRSFAASTQALRSRAGDRLG